MIAPMKVAEIPTLVSALPEIYQSIFGHPEFAVAAARGCEDRLTHFVAVHDRLREALGRPVRVLDLGCAQGYFSLALASRGAAVVGIDFSVENVALCSALAAEHPGLNAVFSHATVEQVIGALPHNTVDMVLGLSVFHHLVHVHGVDAVRRLLTKLAERVAIGVFEMALHTEPLYWASSQPEDPCELLTGWSEMHFSTHCTTHLSAVARPMIVAKGHANAGSYWNERPAVDQSHNRVLYSVPSVQRTADDRAAFFAFTSSSAVADTCTTQERDGGVSPVIRVFLNAQLEKHDLLVDLSPAAGFVLLSAGTLVNAPTILAVIDDDTQRADLERSARAASVQCTTMANDANAVETVMAHIQAHGLRGGRVFIHSNRDAVGSWSAHLSTEIHDGTVIAWCIADGSSRPNRAAVAAQLHALQMAPMSLTETNGELLLVNASPEADEFIAVHQSAGVAAA